MTILNKALKNLTALVVGEGEFQPISEDNIKALMDELLPRHQ